MLRGSRKHILDWVDQEGFPFQLFDLIAKLDIKITPDDHWVPIGHRDPAERQLDEFGSEFLSDIIDWGLLRDWWLAHKKGAKTPTWDLISTGRMFDKKGLILVEAKAHENEIRFEGKFYDPNASIKSKGNHDRIGVAIKEANEFLTKCGFSCNLSRDSHYQLANRIAWSWKVASQGVPVLLIYLGFVGDSGIANVGEPFRNQDHWECTMQKYMDGVVPQSFVGEWANCGKASMQMILRSKKIIQATPSKL